MLGRTMVMLLMPFLLFNSLYAFNTPTKHQKNQTVHFTIQDHKRIESNTAKTRVTVNQTLLNKSTSEVKKQIIKQFQNILPDIQWSLKKVEQNQNASGTTNIKLKLQARLTQKQIDQLRSQIKNQKNQKANQKIKMHVLSFKPSKNKIREAQKTLMIEMYQNAQQYLDKFNRSTNNHFHIQSVYFNQKRMRQGSRHGNQMNMMAKPASDNSKGIAQKVYLTMNVTFAQSPAHQAKAGKNQSQKHHLSVQQPAYLSVPHFKKCLKTEKHQTWSAYCMPGEKPSKCPEQSWQKLEKLNMPECGQS